MLRYLIAVYFVIGAVKAEENRWVWGKGQRNQRAFSNDDVSNKYENFYSRDRDREPTTQKPPPGQTSAEDFLNPDDLRNYNGPPNFGFPAYGQGGGGGPTNNFPSAPGYGQRPAVNVPQNNPNGGYPYPNGQPGFPVAGGGYPGGFPQPSISGYPVPQGIYPNQGSYQGYPQTGPAYPVQQGGGYPGSFSGQGLGGVPFPQPGAAGGYPGQGGFSARPAGYPSQFPSGTGGYPSQNGQPQIGQYTGCGPFGNCGQLNQYPGLYPGQFPYPYPGFGQYPYQEPFAHPHHAGNPYGVTPYNSNGGRQHASSPSDDYEDLSKNGTDNTKSALKIEGKSTSNSKISEKHKHKKAYE